MIKIKKIFALLIGLSWLGCAQKPTAPKAEEKEKPMTKNTPEMKTATPVDYNFIVQHPLSPKLGKQKVLLQEKSQKTTLALETDGHYLIGNFSSGKVEITVTGITDEPASILGKIEGNNLLLDFLAYRITSDELEEIKVGDSYILHWMESICYLEPFEQGYQRRLLAYKVEMH